MARPPVLTDLEIAELVVKRVADRAAAITWVAIILAESGGDPVAYNLVDHNPDEPSYLSTDNGLLQINSYWHGDNIPVHLANHKDAAWAYAHGLAENKGGFTFWNAYTNGQYERYVERAVAAVDVVLPQPVEQETKPMGVVWHDRTDWVDPNEPVTGPAFPEWSQITDGIVVHYPGHDNIPATPAAVPVEIARDHHYYLTSRGYSLGYNFIIDPFGEIWAVRGWDYRNAANKGDTSYNVNHRSISVQMMVGVTDDPTEAQMVALRAFVAEVWARAGVELAVNPHSYWGATACPGDQLRARIAAGEAIPQPPTPSENQIMFRWRHSKYANQFLIVDANIIRVTGTLVKRPEIAATDLVVEDDDLFLRQCCARTGVDISDMEPI